MRAQNETAIHWTESTDRDALSEIDDLYFLLVEDLLHRVTLISCKSDARVFEVEVEAIELQRLGAHFLSCPEDVNILARFCFLCLGALLGIVLAVTPAQQQLASAKRKATSSKLETNFLMLWRALKGRVLDRETVIAPPRKWRFEFSLEKNATIEAMRVSPQAFRGNTTCGSGSSLQPTKHAIVAARVWQKCGLNCDTPPSRNATAIASLLNRGRTQAAAST